MRRCCIISALIFIVGCSVSDQAVGVRQEKTKDKEPLEIVNQKQKIPKIKEKTVKSEEAKPKEETIVKQKNTKSNKSSAEEQIMAVTEEELMQEITGLIIEETVTKIGYEFYEYFFIKWKSPPGAHKHYNILITERVSSTWGSLIEVNIGESTVWSGMLKPSSEEIEDAAQQAVEAATEYLNNGQKQQPQTEDMAESGI
jgi:curli production assembly/transport component CsgE